MVTVVNGVTMRSCEMHNSAVGWIRMSVCVSVPQLSLVGEGKVLQPLDPSTDCLDGPTDSSSKATKASG